MLELIRSKLYEVPSLKSSAGPSSSSSIFESDEKLDLVSHATSSEQSMAVAAVPILITQDTASQDTNACISNLKHTITSVSRDTGASENIDSDALKPLTDVDYSESQKLSEFVTPRKNGTTAEKLSFLSVHPIQPSGDKNSLPFDGNRVYYRKMLPLLTRLQFVYAMLRLRFHKNGCSAWSLSESQQEKITEDEHISSSQHNQDSDLQSEKEDDEDVLDLDQTRKGAMCFPRSGLDVC
ncbi:hypothetical protein EVAR_93008_1 [Eumeta japonica]|uniref:Uncharacterized protein n=1 Tax=Eumeta variegata TaxID=151549 RepID=A0A4C1TAK3_EUMVA|nr:hypothetical protein EVAR_93008_1 [Eumeta japonica]